MSDELEQEEAKSFDVMAIGDTDAPEAVAPGPLVEPWEWTQPLVNFPSRADWEQARMRERYPDGVPYGYRATKAKYAEQFEELLNGREPFPAPTRTSREHAMLLLQPAPVQKLAEFAREHSWEVRTQYSQGHFPHGTTGRPGALKDVIGVRFGAHPVTDRQAYAIYARNVSMSGASLGTWTWMSFMVWGPDLPPAKLHDLAALKAYLLMAPDSRADALADWTRDLRSIEENRKSLAKQRAKARPAKEREHG
jgi:hypothetical protein